MTPLERPGKKDFRRSDQRRNDINPNRKNGQDKRQKDEDVNGVAAGLGNDNAPSSQLRPAVLAQARGGSYANHTQDEHVVEDQEGS